ncbi:MAG: PaaI family thioesterase [Deferrisomatales bacterium]|nr:PaaI family thioesterase [Deferrisomatales bacterium]
MERLPSFRSCYFCGTENRSGLGIRYFRDGGKDRVWGSVDPGSMLCGYPGILHGGIQAALLDDVIYWAVAYRFALTSVTVSLNTRFRAPARLGRAFRLEAWVAVARGRKVTARGELRDAKGGVVAEGEGVYLLHPTEVFREQMLPYFDFSGCSEAMRARFGG